MVILNQQPPILRKKLKQLDWSDVPVQVHKYQLLDIENVLQLDDCAKTVLFEMIPYLNEGFKSTLFDYKVVELKKGQCGCKLSGWHIDVTRNPNHNNRPEQHLIYTTEVGTEFLLTEIETDVDDFWKEDLDFSPQVVWKAPANAIVEYNRLNMHRGPRMVRDCKRVLIRITQTDLF